MSGSSFYSRHARLILLLFAIMAPVLFVGAFDSIRSNTNKVEDWLPKTFPETRQLTWFRRHFVADQFVVISWEGCTLGGDPSDPDASADDPRIEQLANTLIVAQGNEEDAHFFKTVTTGRRVLNELTTPPSSIPYEEAVDRLQGSLIGPDGRQTCVVVTLTDEGLHNLRRAIGRGRPAGPVRPASPPSVLFQALRECNISPEAAHIGGPPVDNVAIDEEGERTLIRLAGLSGLLGLGLAWWSLRSVKLTLIVFSCGVLSAALGLAIVWWTGNTMDAVLLSMPSLVYVLAISGAVHLINHYNDAMAHGGPESAPAMAIRHGWKPALLCSVTTAIGLASLNTSELEPIRKFGLYSAIGVICMLSILFTFLPSALQVWPVTGRRHDRDTDDDRAAHKNGALRHTTWIDRLWDRLGNAIIRRHWLVSAVCYLLIAAIGWGVTRVHTSIDLLKLFDNSARILQDYAWLEQHLGRLVPMEVVLRFPARTQAPIQPQEEADANVGSLSFLQRMETVDLIQQVVEERFGPQGRDVIGKSMSAATFAPELPGSGASYLQRSGTNRQLAASRDGFIDSGYLRVDPDDGSELWRVSLRVAAFEGIDYGQFVNELRRTVEPIVRAQHIRNEVLRKIAEQRADSTYAGANVLLVVPADRDADPHQQRILAQTVRTLLAGDRLRVQQTSVEPDRLAQTQGDKLNNFDYVLLVGSATPAEQQAIGQHAKTVAVARELASSSPDPVNDNHLDSDNVSAVYTGVVPIVYKAQRVLLSSLIQSTFWSFVTITPLMMFVCRSVLGGFVVMIPNALPVLVVFGGMGWLGVFVDIGSMMTASIALGVAVDDTIHFLSWFRDDLRQLPDRRSAILAAYRRCATPTLQAAMISGLGLSVFAFSTFTPTQRFGWLMLTILLAGVVSELIMLPAILAGPLGHAFTKLGMGRRSEGVNTGNYPLVPSPHLEHEPRGVV